MKVIFSLLSFLFCISLQAQKFDCASKMNAYQDYFKANRLKESYADWSEVRINCPKAGETIYADGLQILQYKIDNAASAEEKEKWVRDKMKLYDELNKNYPLTLPTYEVNKAMVLYNNKIDAKEELFNLMESGFLKAPDKITDPVALYVYYTLYYDKFKADRVKYPADLILDKFTTITALLNTLEAANPEKKADYLNVKNGIRAISKELFGCDNLSMYLEKNFEANKTNAVWLETGLENFTIKCGGNPMYTTLAEAYYKIKATPKSAHYMAITSLKQRKFEEATTFFLESESLETDPLEKAKTDYLLATGVLNKEKTKAKEFLVKATTLDPKMGKAYVFLAQMYANAATECGKTDFEKKACYTLAIETLKKVAAAEPKLKPTADKMMADYTTKAVTENDIKQAKMKGKSITIGCWINETVTFPSK